MGKGGTQLTGKRGTVNRKKEGTVNREKHSRRGVFACNCIVCLLR